MITGDAVTHNSQSPDKPVRPRWKKRWWALGVVFALLVWVGMDVYAPRRIDIRAFDPKEVARLDTVMWRSYYEKERLRLFLQLAELIRTQYHFPFLKSHVVAYRAAKAAFIFKGGHSHADYEKALPDLVAFYRAIRNESTLSFEPVRTAWLELDWWIVHRERLAHAPGDLEGALAETVAALYGVPAAQVMEYAKLRAEAMTLRDTIAERGTVTEDDWRKINALLEASWQSLWKAIQP